MADKYLLDFAAQNGLTYMANARTFKAKNITNKECAVGLRNGLPISVGFMQNGNVRLLGLLIRMPALTDRATLLTTLKAMDTFKGIISKKNVAVGPGAVNISWPTG